MRKFLLVLFLLTLTSNALAESRLLYKFGQRDAYLLCVDEKLWVYTFIGLGIETTSTRNPFWDMATETRDGMDQKECSTGI